MLHVKLGSACPGMDMQLVIEGCTQLDVIID